MLVACCGKNESALYSLHSSTQLDINVKGAMIRDLLNMAGYMLPDKDDVVVNPPSSSDATYCPYFNYIYHKLVTF